MRGISSRSPSPRPPSPTGTSRIPASVSPDVGRRRGVTPEQHAVRFEPDTSEDDFELEEEIPALEGLMNPRDEKDFSPAADSDAPPPG